MSEEKKKDVRKIKRKLVSTWLKRTSYILTTLVIISDYFSNLGETYIQSSAEAVGATFWTLVGGVIALSCGHKCSKWASEIKKSPNIAYIIGFIFSLFGLLIYWIYYKIIKIKKKK